MSVDRYVIFVLLVNYEKLDWNRTSFVRSSLSSHELRSSYCPSEVVDPRVKGANIKDFNFSHLVEKYVRSQCFQFCKLRSDSKGHLNLITIKWLIMVIKIGELHITNLQFTVNMNKDINRYLKYNVSVNSLWKQWIACELILNVTCNITLKHPRNVRHKTPV